MIMPARSYSSGILYRFGFNGKENDNEVKGTGNQQDYGMRIYDPRAGRFLSVDPITANYPMLTPYQFASNRPIDGIDIDGLEYMKGKISVYGLNKFEVPSSNYTRGSVWIKNQDIHKIVLDHEKANKIVNEERLDDPAEPADLAIDLKVTKQRNIKQENWWAKGKLKEMRRQSATDVASTTTDAIKFGISLYYNLKDKAEMDYAGKSMQALSDADKLVRNALMSPTFPAEKLSDPSFLTDLTNYVTDGTLPGIKEANLGYIRIVKVWGDLLYNNDAAINNGNFDFSPQRLVPKQKILQTGSGTQYPINYHEVQGNSSPDVIKANELIKDQAPSRSSTVGSGG